MDEVDLAIDESGQTSFEPGGVIMDLESDVHETPDLPNLTLELISPDSFTGVDQDLTQLADGVHSVRFQQNAWKAVSV